MRPLRALPVLLVTTCLCVTACGGPSNQAPADDLATDATFTFAIAEDLGSFDPYHNAALGGYTSLAYDSLVSLQADGEFVSGLAEEWTVDERSATFTLRPDITCSDGAPLTASQVAADLTYLSDPANQSPLYGGLIPTVPLTATGDDETRTVEITLESPFGFLLHTIGRVPIVCANGLKDRELLEDGSDGTGPYTLSAVVPGQSYTFTIREDYAWGPDGASTDAPGIPVNIVLRIIPNETTATNLLLSGEINLARVTGRDQQRLSGLERLETPLSAAWLWFNEIGDRPAADQRVRQALIQALDIDQLITVSTGGSGRAATGVVATEPKPCPGDTVSGQLPGHDISAAEALLEDAGWLTGADGSRSKNGDPLTINLHYTPSWSPSLKPTTELLAQQWSEIGAQVEITANTVTTQVQVMYETSAYDVYVNPGAFSLPSSAAPLVSGPIPPEGRNLAGIDNPDYEALATKAGALPAPEACTYWDQAEQALWRDLNPVPISDQSWYYYLNNARAEQVGFGVPTPTSIRMLR